jgi:hypothetical protein
MLDFRIIYEVNLSVPEEKATGYQQWLATFTQSVCDTVQGFTHAIVYSQPKPEGLHWLSEEKGKVYFTVHYHVNSQQHLQDYLDRHQDRVAHEEETKWNYVVLSRRILKLQSATKIK